MRASERTGSSPLARGALSQEGIEGERGGLIPAGAGRTPAPATRCRWVSAHPRWRGAHLPPAGPAMIAMGSSPLARGAQRQRPRLPRLRGLIPAGAGRTSPLGRRPSGPGAHPRWRGAHAIAGNIWTMAAGSSPLARGALRRGDHGQVCGGLIPAGAGRTGSTARPGRSRWAHPRWRGAHRSRILRKVARMGSSPLARGARGRLHRPRREPRLIPAGAGRTARTGRPPTACAAHPRWRGAHLMGPAM